MYPRDDHEHERISWPRVFQGAPRSIQFTSLVVAGSMAIEALRAVTQMVTTIITTIVQPIIQMVTR